ncbi:hypothetical protein ACQFYA_17825 [Promicromonospora sp. Marseille-Q5078]
MVAEPTAAEEPGPTTRAPGAAPSDAGAAERIVFGAAAVGLAFSVVMPTVWPAYPWTTTSWVWVALVLPPAVAVVGALRAHRRLPGSSYALAATLDVVLALGMPLGLWWGVGPGAASAVYLIVAGAVLWAGRPRRGPIVGWGVLVLCLSLVGSTGLGALVVPDGWWPAAASALNAVALAMVVRRAACVPRGGGARSDRA